MNKQISAFLLSATIITWYAPAYALAVSDIHLNSHLNQKLSAEVQLLSVTASELDQLDIRIVGDSNDTVQYEQSGLDVEISQYPSGQHYLHIVSKKVIREPIVSFSLELSWPEGRIERKYVLLIDPKKG